MALILLGNDDEENAPQQQQQHHTEKTPLLADGSSGSAVDQQQQQQQHQSNGAVVVAQAQGNDAAAEKPKTVDDAAWYFKLLALLCACLLSLGSHYAANTLGSLKKTFKQEMNITNTEYGSLQSSVSFVNTFIPIFGGYIIDIFGTGVGSCLASFLIMGGEWVFALATAEKSFPLMLVGRIIYGLGSGSIVTVQETILAHWFRGKGLAVAVGIQITVSKLAGFLAANTVVPISKSLPRFENVFLVSASMCTLSFAINLAYVAIMRYGLKIQENKEELERLKKKKGMKISEILSLKPTLWAIMLICFFFGFVWNPVLHISSEYIKLKFDHSDETAGSISSIQLALPIIISPFLGAWVDQFGQRPLIALIAGTLATLSIVLLAFTQASVYISMVLMSLSISLGPIALIAAVPMVVPISAVGTAYGLYKCTGSIGTTIIDPILGKIQDSSIYHNDETGREYETVMLILAIFGAITTVTCGALHAMDYFLEGRLLSMSSVERMAFLKTKKEAEQKQKQLDQEAGIERVAPFWTVSGIAGAVWILAVLIISWGIFFTLSINN